MPESAVVAEDFLTPDSARDLQVDRILAQLCAAAPDHGMADIFRMPLTTVEAVEYRHEVFADLARAEVLAPFDAFAAGMAAVRERLDQGEKLFHQRQRQRWHLDSVQEYCGAVVALQYSLAETDIRSRGLVAFEAYLAEYISGPDFQRLVEETESVAEELANVRYCVHIDNDQVHVERYASQPDFALEVQDVLARLAGQARPETLGDKVGQPGMNSVEERILDCVAELFPRVFDQLDRYCRRNAKYLDPTLLGFERETRFYLSYLGFMRRFEPLGVTFCLPELGAGHDEPGIRVDAAADLGLALHLLADRTRAGDAGADSSTRLVCNDFELVGNERILVVTGPNQSGKTAFARTLGQLGWFAAFGVPVPARRARLVLPDRVFTHFERRESLATLHGRLDEELVRVREILAAATARSVIVMNESFSSTSSGDAVALGAEIMARIVESGAVAVYVTSLDELSRANAAAVSMVGEVDDADPTRRTFRFHRRAADGVAYAQALASRYGLTYDAMFRRIASGGGGSGGEQGGAR
ncbi:MAG: DNA mismatch repair protein MutS [Mycobacteriaceae bacterium]|nr:DNA mismatch repair protein MutS [Mycobacteriaceae bacterium]